MPRSSAVGRPVSCAGPASRPSASWPGSATSRAPRGRARPHRRGDPHRAAARGRRPGGAPLAPPDPARRRAPRTCPDPLLPRALPAHPRQHPAPLRRRKPLAVASRTYTGVPCDAPGGEFTIMSVHGPGTALPRAGRNPLRAPPAGDRFVADLMAEMSDRGEDRPAHRGRARPERRDQPGRRRRTRRRRGRTHGRSRRWRATSPRRRPGSGPPHGARSRRSRWRCTTRPTCPPYRPRWPERPRGTSIWSPSWPWRRRARSPRRASTPPRACPSLPRWAAPGGPTSRGASAASRCSRPSWCAPTSTVCRAAATRGSAAARSPRSSPTSAARRARRCGGSTRLVGARRCARPCCPRASRRYARARRSCCPPPSPTTAYRSTPTPGCCNGCCAPNGASPASSWPRRTMCSASPNATTSRKPPTPRSRSRSSPACTSSSAPRPRRPTTSPDGCCACSSRARSPAGWWTPPW